MNDAAPGEGRHAPVTVLVVDDNTDIRRLIRLTLAKSYDVLEAEDGEQALRLVGERRPQLVILDIMMPGVVDGLQVLDHIKESAELAHIPVAMVTARGQSSDWDEGVRRGADAYFVKPFSPRDLLEWVESVLD